MTKLPHLFLHIIEMARVLHSQFATELLSEYLVPSVSCSCHGERQGISKMGRQTLLGGGKVRKGQEAQLRAEALPGVSFFDQRLLMASGIKAPFLLEGALPLSFYPGSIAA